MNSSGNTDKKTIIEEGSELKGTLTSSCGVVVRGRLDGDIETPSLSVSASGAVHGRAKVGEVESEGELSGEFDADVVRLAGTIRDNTVIRARTLEVKLEASTGKMQVMFGECELAVGDEPADDAVKRKRKRDGKSEAPPPPEAAFDPTAGTS
jgi:cytoskeletal protein CcmA (bactofilin family)